MIGILPRCLIKDLGLSEIDRSISLFLLLSSISFFNYYFLFSLCVSILLLELAERFTTLPLRSFIWKCAGGDASSCGG